MAATGLRLLCSRKVLLSFLLIFYIYMPFIAKFTWQLHKLPIVEYILYVAILVIGLFIDRKCNEKLMVFFLGFSALILLNFIVSENAYYVFIEGVQALLFLIIPSFIVSKNGFSLTNFIKNWYCVSKYAVVFLVLSLVLVKNNILNYSIFNSLCVPNVFILTYDFWNYDRNIFDLGLLIANIVILMFLGGRVAAIASIVMFVLAYLIYSNVRFISKVGMLIVFSLVICLVGFNLVEFVVYFKTVLNSWGFESRTLLLLSEQLRTGTMYFTGRDIIYELCINYLQEDFILPGGFGVVLSLTEGKYYYAHNFILQFLITFGFLGAIGIILLFWNRLKQIKYLNNNVLLKLLLFMFCSVMLIGMTGSSFWIHFLSTIFISLMFFYNYEKFN